MIDLWEAVFLGAIQGLTEFLPVSSSGHLVLFQNILGIREHVLAFDIAVHWGTLSAVLIYFLKDVLTVATDIVLFAVKYAFGGVPAELSRRHPHALVGGFVILASIATGIVGYVFRDAFLVFFNWLPIVGVAWILTGFFLIVSKRFQNGDRSLPELNHQDAFWVGMIQGFATVPGISRTGVTVLMGMLLGLEREAAAKYSFLLAIPAIIGAGLLEARAGIELFAANPKALIAGFLSAAVVGFLCIFFLFRIVRSGKFYIFGFYCLAMGIFALVYHMMQLALS